ncbi:MAG: hypothetical protein Q4G67_06110 [Actinomycetia bacterium]|nr:hypothetical protein [Actinomycetes bacterium]
MSRRRYPNFVAFIGTGAVLGMAVGALISMTSGNVSARFSEGAALGYMAVAFGFLGAILGGVAGVLAESVLRRRAR